MKKLFKGRFISVWDYLLHIGPLASFWLINFIAATVIAIAMALVLWWTRR